MPFNLTPAEARAIAVIGLIVALGAIGLWSFGG